MNARTLRLVLLNTLSFVVCCLLVSFFFLQDYDQESQNQQPFQNLTETHLSLPHLSPETLQKPSKNISFFTLCPKNFTNYLPCHHPSREKRFSIERHFRRERHCPEGEDEKLRCLVPKPNGYKRPFRWPESKYYAWFKNVPSKKLADFKKSQNWVRLEGERLIFPGGGTTFPDGVEAYVDIIRSIVPLVSGSVRTVLDVGCGVASFGAHLLSYDILTMSMAPRDIHEAQVQFALERGLPAMIGVLSIHRLPYPSRAFDMAHCSRCLVDWTAYDGLYLMEIDRVLRPGGYWVLSGPPISQQTNHKDSQDQKVRLADVARRLCWKKMGERHRVAVWRKPKGHAKCVKELETRQTPGFCNFADPDMAWYNEMQPCITPLPDRKQNENGSAVDSENWPERLNALPLRIKAGLLEAITSSDFTQDNRMWHERVAYYVTKLKYLAEGRYRNVMDMNAGLGGFAAALIKFPVWVMNVVPFDAEKNTLGVIYERGLIGTYMNWCEPFSSYPRTYDLIHANGVFTMYTVKCDIVDILLEMHRLLRPEGAVIVRDCADVIGRVKTVMDRMRWKGVVFDGGNSDKILIVNNSGSAGES